jgi:hypothetical protein
MTKRLLKRTLLFSLTSLCCSAGTIYSNNFENPATAFSGLTASGTLTSLSTVTLPTDSGGISSPNQSTYLGDIGLNVDKNDGTYELVSLSLSGLVPGATYNVAFDLFIGGKWNGSNAFDGPDEWTLTAASGTNTSTLVDATFSNCAASNDFCAGTSLQTYSDTTPTGGLGGTEFDMATGADFSSETGTIPAQLYAIYDFGYDSGDPALSFTADASTATLNFERLNQNVDHYHDQSWGVDNILVTGAQASAAPEPGTNLLAMAGVCAIAVLKMRAVRSRNIGHRRRTQM